jgi:hypothetical protein
MLRCVVAAIALISASGSARSQTYAVEDIARRTIERRAIEAVNRGMSAVNTDLMLQEMLDKTAGRSTR